MQPGLAGTTLADRYDILDLIGAGGMGEVYRARDRELDELVALKVIRTDRANDTELVARFRHEVKLARRVTHANVARTFELGQANGLMFCTMELIEGESLTRRLSTMRRLTAAEACTIASSVCEGLAAAHGADVIHRDIKPDNVLLANDGRVVITDFGVASINVRAQGELSGTPQYMAPEQARGEPATPAADVYALGVVLYEMLSGRRGFSGNVTEILTDKQQVERLVITPGDVPQELCDVIAKATARELDQRFATAEQLRRALEPWGRTRRATSTPVRATTESAELQQVIVTAPKRAGDGARLYIAEAVHDELLTRLARKPRVRVMPRVEAEAVPDALVIGLTADDRLHALITCESKTMLELHLPLDVAHVKSNAQAVVDAAESVLELAMPVAPIADAEALDLMLRARHVVSHDLMKTPEAIAHLERANALAPHEPRIAALLAILQVRKAFFLGSTDPTLMQQAASLAQTAVRAAPELAESHLAMAHVHLHLGDAASAAGHFRAAITCSPHNAEAHEYLGRLLLEAGFIDAALARLEDSLQIAPQVRAPRWEIARAWALEGRWDEFEVLVKQLADSPGERALARARFAWWRRDMETARELRKYLGMFNPKLIEALFAVYLDGAWEQCKPIFMTRDKSSPDLRRRSFGAQLAAEAAGFANDVDACADIIDYAIEQGLFDLHWMDRCPLLESLRAVPAKFQPLRARIKARADAILDAMYGDHKGAETDDTQLASSAELLRVPGR